MKAGLFYTFLLIGITTFSQNTSPMDALSYGVVLDDPGTKNVTVKADITFLKDAKGSLNLDIYSPPGLQTGDRRPAIIFLNAIGERTGERKVKSWGIYTSWPKLMAANGYIGISMETDVTRIQESIKSLFDFIAAKGSQYNIDKDRLGVYAASANVTGSATYLMSEKVYPGIKAAAFYYGAPLTGPFRKDLPVLFIISEGDVSRSSYGNLMGEVLKNNAPWTIKMGSGMPHAFDAYLDNDEARKIIKETISFWKNNLDPVPVPSWAPSKGRNVLGLIQMNRPKAVELLKTLVAENPNDIQTLELYADVLRQDSDLPGAEAALKKVLSLQPKNIRSTINLAGISYQQHKIAQGDQYASAAINSGSMTNNLYADLGFALLVAGLNKQAAVYYEKAVATESPRALDYYNLGCAYAKEKDTENALKALAQSIRYGFDSKQQFENDTDLTSLKTDERFKVMVAGLK